jgi:hypothetical protein
VFSAIIIIIIIIIIKTIVAENSGIILDPLKRTARD